MTNIDISTYGDGFTEIHNVYLWFLKINECEFESLIFEKPPSN